MIDLNQMIADMETRRATLISLATSGTVAGFAIKCGPMCIEIVDDAGDRADACGVERATVYMDRAQAERMAKRISNGAGERGRVMPLGDALAEEINSIWGSLVALREAVAKQG